MSGDMGAYVEAFKKAAAITTGAALNFYLPTHLWSEGFWGGDPVWCHITITMLCELDSIDRLGEKIVLRIAGTTIGAVAGLMMSYEGLDDLSRLAVFFVWSLVFAYCEKKDSSRSYCWTIAAVTFGICVFLPRWGRSRTAWKRWWSIMQGTAVAAFWLWVVPLFGILRKPAVSQEFHKMLSTVCKESLTMVADALEQPGEAQSLALVKASDQKAAAALRGLPVSWRKYHYCRTGCEWFSKSNDHEFTAAKELLAGPMTHLYQSCASAARAGHTAAKSPQSVAAVRACIVDVRTALDSYFQQYVTLGDKREEVAAAVAKEALKCIDKGAAELSNPKVACKSQLAQVLLDATRLVQALSKETAAQADKAAKQLEELL